MVGGFLCEVDLLKAEKKYMHKTPPPLVFNLVQIGVVFSNTTQISG
jgi:hypothetical protein